MKSIERRKRPMFIGTFVIRRYLDHLWLYRKGSVFKGVKYYSWAAAIAAAKAFQTDDSLFEAAAAEIE